MNDLLQVAESLGDKAIIITLIVAIVVLVFIFVFYKMWKGFDDWGDKR